MLTAALFIAQPSCCSLTMTAARLPALLSLLMMVWSHGALADHWSHRAEVDKTTTVIIHIADLVNVTGTLPLASPQTIGIDRVRLLQSLMPYRYTTDTRIVSARRYGNQVSFELSAPGKIALPVHLHLLLEDGGELNRLASMNAADMSMRRSQNSFRIGVVVDPTPFVLLDRATAARQLILVIAPM